MSGKRAAASHLTPPSLADRVNETRTSEFAGRRDYVIWEDAGFLARDQPTRNSTEVVSPLKTHF